VSSWREWSWRWQCSRTLLIYDLSGQDLLEGPAPQILLGGEYRISASEFFLLFWPNYMPSAAVDLIRYSLSLSQSISLGFQR
jgi:hypothetical protein